MMTCHSCGAKLVSYCGEFVCACYLANPSFHSFITRDPATRVADKRVLAEDVRHVRRARVRHERPEYTLRLRIDATLEPTPHMHRQRTLVDAVAFWIYGRPWDSLRDRERTRVFEAINGMDGAPLSVGQIEHMAELLRMGMSVQQTVTDTKRVYLEAVNASARR